MEFRYNQRGADRKRLVQAIAEHLEEKATYLNTPTFAYEVGFCTIDRDGTITIDERVANSDDISNLLDHLRERGFEPDLGDSERLTLELPRVGMSDTAIENFVKLVEGKATLIKKALNADRLDIRVDDEKISLPWFNDTPDTETVQAFMQLAGCLLAKANSQQRVTLQDKPVENEKYAFRCFLLRLGFIVDEYKAARKTLLKNLDGNSAFKNFEPPHSIY